MKEYKGKRLFDIFFSVLIIVIAFPIIIFSLLLVWVQDFKSPLYISKRVGYNNHDFNMFKIRSMVKGADQNGVNSTSKNDKRVTLIGHIIRKFKIDELSQFFNVINGSMSVVGPRPNTREQGVNLYTNAEMKLLSIKPGITDFASIIFSDEGQILSDSKNPDLDYNKIIRPWKSKLGLLYVKKNSFVLDVIIIYLTIICIFNREFALRKINKLVKNIHGDDELASLCLRNRRIKIIYPPK